MNITVLHAAHTCTYVYVLIYIIYTCRSDVVQQLHLRYTSDELRLINSYDTWHGMYVHAHVLIHQVSQAQYA